MKKNIILAVIAIACIFLIKELEYQSRRVKIMTGFASKFMCSCLFTSDMNEKEVARIELGFSPISNTSSSVDHANKTVTSSVFGLMPRSATYIEGRGCVINLDEKTTTPYRSTYNIPDTLASWFEYNKDNSHLNLRQQSEVNRLVKEGFTENLGDDKPKNTRAIVVIHKGQLIAESYDEGVSKDTKLLGWSMTKSLIATVAGAMIRDGKMTLDDKVSLESWQNDHRKHITYRNLLNMQSGINWEEDYGKISSVTKMLFNKPNMGSYASSFPLNKKPGTSWYYSSGTSNMLSYILSKHFGSQQEYIDYVYEVLRNEIGMKSLTIETDAAGYPIASSYGWATARDWAKLGLLYLNNGQWNNTQMLEEDWVDFVKRPVEGSNGEYGGHFWLNSNGYRYPKLPKDLLFCDGYQGQRVFIFPSHDVVIVRLGAMYKVDDAYLDKWASDILDAVK